MSSAFAADWLRRQRWFRAKQRPIASVTEVDRAALPATDASLLVLAVGYADTGPDDRYLLIEAGGREPRDGEGAWRAIVSAMREAAELRGGAGRFVGSSTGAFSQLVAGTEIADLAERRLAVEQSNTSVVLGADPPRLILKLYRLLEPGVSPDLEVSEFLTEVGFADTPALAGSMTYQAGTDAQAGAGPTSAAAMLQAFVPSTGDAWAAMLRALAEAPTAGIGHAAAIGRLTAALHAALASRPDDPRFPVRASTTAEAAGWRAAAERELAQAIGALSGEQHRRLVSLAPRIRARFADTFGAAAGAARVSRIHGDYHLGQLLHRTDGGFSVIDFEGEPARPLAARRVPASPLRDVAGMLRSLDYAARTAEAGSHAPAFEAGPWLADAREAFASTYGIGAADAALVDAFELEKACYEIRYEASNRPGWLWLPLDAVERLVA